MPFQAHRSDRLSPRFDAQGDEPARPGPRVDTAGALVRGEACRREALSRTLKRTSRDPAHVREPTPSARLDANRYLARTAETHRTTSRSGVDHVLRGCGRLSARPSSTPHPTVR